MPEGTGVHDQADGIPLGLLDMEEPAGETTETESKTDDQTDVEAEKTDESDKAETEESAESSEGEESKTEESEESDQTEEADDSYLLIGDEKVSYDEIGELWAQKANMHKGFTQKTQALAEERKAFEADRAQASEEAATLRTQYKDRLEQLDNALEKLAGEEPDWPTLRKELSPEEYSARVADWQLVQGQREKAAKERDALAQQEAQEFVAKFESVRTEQREKLLEIEPQFGEPEYAAQWVSYVKAHGFTDQDLAATVDHRLYLLVDKARKYDELAEKREVVKQKVKEAPVVKPGVRPAKGKRSRQADEAKVKRLRKTGSLEDAMAAAEDMDEKLFDL